MYVGHLTVKNLLFSGLNYCLFYLNFINIFFC